MPRYSYDLHIHSCLSPCGDEDMIPANIVGMAALKELDIIAVTDHNSSKNCPAVLKLADQYNITAIPGMELCTLEEVHVLCLFADLDHAMLFDKYVSSRLILFPNDEKVFGKQEIYDEEDHLIGIEQNLLINATDITFDSLKHTILGYHGIIIPAHIDKTSNSLISNLGFVPPDSDFNCVELKERNKWKDLCKYNPYLNQCNIIYNSDAHSLGQINEPIHYLEAISNKKENIIRALVDNHLRM